MRFASRNDALRFAGRTRKNLKAIEQAFADGKDVHVVTQLAVSLLGLVVFPWEQNFAERVKKLKLDNLKGWPQWKISIGTCKTLGELVRHLRNAIAHGHLRFSSDSRFMAEIDIEIEDRKDGAMAPHWQARICATELRDFCFRFINLLEETIG